MNPRNHAAHAAHVNPIVRNFRTSMMAAWPQMATNTRYSGGCHQVSRLIVSAPGELRLGANNSVFAISQPNSGGTGDSSYRRPLTRGALSESLCSSPACER